MPSADFCPAIRPPYGALSRRSDTAQISWGKFSRFPCTVAGSTLRILDGYGLSGKWPARPTLAPGTRFLSIDAHVCSTLPSDLAELRYRARVAFRSHLRGGSTNSWPSILAPGKNLYFGRDDAQHANVVP